VLRRWVVKHGPEFDGSKHACDVPPDRLKLHLDAFELDLERDPLRYSQPFAGESRRVIETTDYTGDGFVLTAYVVLYQDFTAEIKWIEKTPLPDRELEEDDPDDDPG
jgi:hypothetical protein